MFLLPISLDFTLLSPIPLEMETNGLERLATLVRVSTRGVCNLHAPTDSTADFASLSHNFTERIGAYQAKGCVATSVASRSSQNVTCWDAKLRGTREHRQKTAL